MQIPVHTYKHDIVETTLSRGHSNTPSMHEVAKNPNDEMYTPYEFIAAEVQNYKEHLKGKRIICPCDIDISKDSDIFSLTIEFDEKPVQGKYSWQGMVNKVKKVKYLKQIDLWDLEINNNPKEYELSGEEAQEFIRTGVKCNFVCYLWNIGMKVGIKSITASGYNPDIDRGIKFQDIDYSQYDVCITNPPFSLYKEFMKIMVDESERRKETDTPFDFILLAPFLNRVNPNVGLPLMLKQCYLGYGRHVGCEFENYKGNILVNKKSVACDWITTFPDAQIEMNKKEFQSPITWELYKDDFYEMENMTMKDGTHPIKVSTKVIPSDYYGWMFVPINFLDNYSENEFEWYGTNFKKYFNTTNPTANPFIHSATNKMLIHNGKQGFHGFLIKRKVK